MVQRYYFDTSIWLDLFEKRDEPGMPKSTWAHQLVAQIIKSEGKILLSDVNLLELRANNYTSYEISLSLKPFKRIISFIEATKAEVGKSKDLALKRDIPRRDALHAILARDHKAVLITFDNHFKEIADITPFYRPNQLIED